MKNELFLKKEKSSFGEIISGVGRLHSGVKFRPPSVFYTVCKLRLRFTFLNEVEQT